MYEAFTNFIIEDIDAGSFYPVFFYIDTVDLVKNSINVDFTCLLS